MSKEKIIETTFKIWGISLGLIVFGGIAIALVNLAIGNYCSTASFEF